MRSILTVVLFILVLFSLSPITDIVRYGLVFNLYYIPMFVLSTIALLLHVLVIKNKK